MLEKNPSKRITTDDILKDPWIKISEKQRKEIDPEEASKVIENLKKYKHQSILKGTALSILIKLKTGERKSALE